MFTKSALKPILVLFVIMLLSTLAVGSAVTAKEPTLTSKSINPAALTGPIQGGPGFISVSTYGFKPFLPTWTMAYSNTWLYNNGSDGANYIAPVNLPHGAIITKLVLFSYDNVPGGGIDFYLQAVDLFNGSLTEVASASSNQSDGLGYVEGEVYAPMSNINNQLYSYVLEADIPHGFGSNLCLVNVRIDYGYPSYFPTVLK